MWKTNKRSGIQLCYPFEVKRLNKWTSPYIVQPKLDGERCRAVHDGATWKLYSSEQNEILSVPHIVDELNSFGEKIPRVELDGELYTHGLQFEDIHSRVGRTVNLHPEFYQIHYNIFDIVSDEPQIERLLQLQQMKSILTSGEYLEIVPCDYADNLEEVMNSYNGFLKDGYEGMVVRHILAPYVRKRSTYVMKFKPKKQDYYQIVGIQEEVDKDGRPKNRLGAFTCTSSDGTIFNVGTGLTEEDREKWWTRGVIGNYLKVEYQHITPGRHVPRFPVFVEVVGEDLVPVSDIIK